MDQQPQSKLSIPTAIIISGVIIAGAVFLSNYKGGPVSQGTPQANEPQTPQTAAIAIAPVTAKDHILGNGNAQVLIVEYSDTECPYCKNFHVTLQQVINNYGKDGKVAWVYRHFPLADLHSRALKEAEASECANELGAADGTMFWKYINRIYEITPANDGLDPAELPKIATNLGLNKTAFESCLSSGKYTKKVEESVTDAVTAGGRGTPFSVVVSKSPLPESVITTIKGMASGFPPGTITFSEDKLRIAVSGALPYSFLDQMLKVILKPA